MISQKKIAIFGLGKEGVSSANFLGKNNQITIIDEKKKKQIDRGFIDSVKQKASFYFGGDLPKVPKFDLILRSPGVRPDNPKLNRLAKGGGTVTSQTKLFFDLFPGKIIGVTGTKGKGTTATLIHQMLKTQVESVFLAGNIGLPPLDILSSSTANSYAVLELSSFQLFDLKRSPHIAVVLMITQEHLDWHLDEHEYKRAKESIVKFQSPQDFAVINFDYSAPKSFVKKTNAKVYFVSTKSEATGAFIKKDKVLSKVANREEIISTKDILLAGSHNLQNVVAATCVAKILGINSQNIASILKNFKGLKHRLELVAEKEGVKFYNDSLSTIPQTTIAAIEAFSKDKIIILGGSSKKSNFKQLATKIHSDKSIKAIILIGQEKDRIKRSIEKAGGFSKEIIEDAKSMKETVKAAKSLAKKGDIVLLSPACASFDMFKNYQDRGNQFIKQVESI